MWIDVQHLGEEIRRQNRKFAVKTALAAILAAGIAIGFFVPFPRSTVDWDTLQADDFRTRGEPWTSKRTRLERGRARRQQAPWFGAVVLGHSSGCQHPSARVRQCFGYCARKSWKPS